jgi:hypothetical protein
MWSAISGGTYKEMSTSTPRSSTPRSDSSWPTTTGSLDPSDEDVAFSRAVHRAGELVGIELYDHLIVTAAGFTSLRERGAL